MISHLHATTIAVSDQDRALDFFVNTLGFEMTNDAQMGPEMRFVSVRPIGATTEIVLGDAGWATESSTLGGPTGISLVTEDIDAAVKTMTERGVRIKGPIEDMPWGQRATWFYDPDDNEFFLVGN